LTLVDQDWVDLSTVNETTKEFHYPFYNYMGPGTHVVERVRSRNLPVSKADAAALIHDINYLRFSGNQELIEEADIFSERFGISDFRDTWQSWDPAQEDLFTGCVLWPSYQFYPRSNTQDW